MRIPLTLPASAHFGALAFGILQFVLNLDATYAAAAFIPSGLVAIVFATLVIPNSLFAWLLLRQPLSRQFLAGSTLAVTGIAFLILNEALISQPGTGNLGYGIVLAVLGVLCASAANLLNASKLLRELPLLPTLAWALLYSVLLSLGLAWFSEGPPVFDLEPRYSMGVVYLGGGATALAFALFYQLLREMGPARAAYTNVLFPIIAMGLSTIFEDYRWSAASVAGAILALTGLVVALRSRFTVNPRASPKPASQLGMQLPIGTAAAGGGSEA